MNLTGVLTLLFLITVKASCPWDDTKLVAWSSVSTWGGSVPVEDEAVVISGKKVLLDISPPALKSITVETGGVLVWGNVDGIKLVVDHILVKGEFHIGAEQCRFTNKAHILLTGFPNTTNTVSGFGSKFIGVPEGGTLEIHGADKLPFTKLMQTISAETLTCGVLYTHRNSSFSEEDRFGLHVTIWRDDGSLYDFNVYPLGDSSVINPEQDFKDFVDGVDDGLIVGVAVYGDIGVNLIPNRNWELVYSSVEKLGGLTSGSSEIRNVQSKDAYAFITKTGEGSSTKEERAKSLYLQESTATSKQKYSSIARGLEFRSRSIVKAVTKTKIENQVDFDVVSTTFSQPIITVRDDVSSWNVGDFQYPHFGEITHGVDERAEVALLTRNILIEGGLQEQCYHTTDAEADLCQKFQRDTFGGHVKFLRGFKAVHIEGVELYHMGQQLIIGTYPLHFHMCDDVDDSWVRQNSIHNTNNRCVTIHGSDGAEIKDNVCFDHIGHGYFLEDSAEIRNVLDGNLGVGTRFGTQLLTDKRSDWCGSVQKKSCGHPATFWITHPMNYFRNNVAAGSEKNGFHIVYAYEPLTSSKARQEIRKKVFRMHARRSKLGQFDDNVAHSNLGFGLMMDNLISMGQIDLLTNEFVPENGLLGSSGYDPREDPSVRNSPRATNHIRRFTSYKNLNNIWTRGGNLIIHNSSFADGETSISLTRSVLDTVQDVRRSVIIGNSDNKGLGFKFTYGKIPAKPSHYFERELPKESNPFNPMVGIEFFNGPVLVTDSIFDKFYHQVWDPTWEKQYGVKAMRPGTAMGFRKNFPYPSFPHSGPRNVRFGFCDKVDGLSVFAGDTSLLAYADPKDGDRQATIRDITGSVTGIPDVQLVRNTPFFMDTDCYYDQVYQMSVCPHWYSKTHLRGSDGVFKDKKDDYPMFMVRDDDPENPFALKGADITSEYHVQGKGDKGLTYLTMQNKSYIAVFNGTNPTSIKIRSNNIQYGNWIRVGICFPKSTTSFTIRATYPEIDDKNPPISVSSIEALEEDETGRAYFWDKKTGLFFVRFVGRLQRTGYEECPGYKCPEYRITRNDGGSAVTDCTSDAYGAYKKSKSTREPIVPPNTPCVRASTVGYGATSPSELSITVPKFPTSCPALPAHEKPTREYRGCYATTSPAYLTAGRTQVLTESMTIDLCVTRCFNMANKYATVALGSTCRCSNDFNIQGQPSKFCGKACTGNQEEICGGNSAYGVYETGAGSISISTSCGSGNEGVLIEGKCYIYKADAVTYVEAEKQCRLLGGNLASIPNSSVQVRHPFSPRSFLTLRFVL
ncbi:hypothetical protein LOTGIDRAFT_228278 [Lottia gigantea]|uniref:G8 domain-containing protein n=1 Tax=Lottia gigantea TaxID=225164 RepID=V4AS36_LOTGI|nr:hypothetical protein LOTGIDRAFT_228278 [Lottia gigantea]ESO97675.1 hypothetical protein LOTGIDRAFT_228278 [Lottia gigantea]